MSSSKSSETHLLSNQSWTITPAGINDFQHGRSTLDQVTLATQDIEDPLLFI